MPYISTTAEYIKTLYIFLSARELKTTGLQKVFHIFCRMIVVVVSLTAEINIKS